MTVAEKEDKSIDVIFNRTSYTIFGAKGNFEVIKINSSNISEKQLNITITDKGPEGTPAEN